MYKVRVILDADDDVIRTLIVDEKFSLEKLHFDIANAFGFDGSEMASFYISDHEWNQGQEIPLFNMAEAGEQLFMSSCITKEILPKNNDKLIYVYDFLHMWTFYVEVIEITTTPVTETKVILSVGEIPKEAPDKIFKSDKIEDEFKDEQDDFFNDFEDLDNLDFDNF